MKYFSPSNKPIFGVSIMLKIATVLSPMLIFLQACGTTDPGNGAGISYQLPRTDAKVTLSADILDCTNPIRADSKFTIAAEAGVQNELYNLSGAILDSNSTKRNLSITTYDNNVISSINSSNTDQKSTIIGSTIKIISSAATAGLLGSKPQIDSPILKCQPAISNAINTIVALKKLNDNDQTNLASAKSFINLQKTIDARALKIANLKAELHMEQTVSIPLEEPQLIIDKYDIRWNVEKLQKYFDIEYIRPSYTRTSDEKSEDLLRFFSAKAFSSFYDSKKASSESEIPKVNECTQAILVPNTKAVKFTLEPTGKFFIPLGNQPRRTASEVMYAAQLATPSLLCISTRFGESRIIGLKYDKFGRTSEFTWSSDSRLANSTSAIAGFASDSGSTIKTLRGSNLAADKAELDELNTKRALEKARQCDAIIEAGGSTCQN